MLRMMCSELVMMRTCFSTAMRQVMNIIVFQDLSWTLIIAKLNSVPGLQPQVETKHSYETRKEFVAII